MQRTLLRCCEVPSVTGVVEKSVSPILHSQQQLIRQLMVRKVLLSPEPLTPKSLLALVRESLLTESQKETADISASTPSIPPYAQYLHSILRPLDATAGHCPVESTMRLLLATDSQFRLSPGGFVCYPTLPSLFAASNHMERDTKLMPAVRRLLQHSHKVPHQPAPASGKTAWSYVLSLLSLLDAESETKNSGHLCAEDEPCAVSRALAEQWMRTYDEAQLPVLLRGDTSGAESHKSRVAEEFQECVYGSEALRRWRLEAKDGYLGAALMNAPQLCQSASLPQLVNEQMGILIGNVVAAPMTIGRLAALVQWSSLPFALHYRSLLHFLDLYAGKSAAMQMERHTMRSLVARRKWSTLLHTSRPRYASQELSDEVCEESSGMSDPLSAWRTRGRGAFFLPRLMDPCRCVFFKPNGSVAEVTDNNEGKDERSENDIIVFGASRYIVERRLCRLLKLWWAFEGQWQQTQKDELRNPTITVRRLSQLCLWEHEYGPVVSSRMMLQFLRCITLPVGNIVRVIPPVECGESVSNSEGEWLVQLQANCTSGQVDCRKGDCNIEMKDIEEDA